MHIILPNFGTVAWNTHPVTQHWWVRNYRTCWHHVLGQLHSLLAWESTKQKCIVSLFHFFFIMTLISSWLFKLTPPSVNHLPFQWVIYIQILLAFLLGESRQTFSKPSFHLQIQSACSTWLCIASQPLSSGCLTALGIQMYVPEGHQTTSGLLQQSLFL